jgi:hypothetical protein
MRLNRELNKSWKIAMLCDLVLVLVMDSKK